MTTTFEALLQQRRSVRSYQDRPVDIDLVRELIREATLAPSSGNGQPWRFIVVNDKALMKRMSDESKRSILARIAADANHYAARYQGMLSDASYNVFYNAPCLVIILGRADWKNLHVDCALAASYLMMAATARGLGTCWINLGAEIHAPAMRAELGIPPDCAIVAPIILGFPETIPPAPKRNEPEILKVIG